MRSAVRPIQDRVVGRGLSQTGDTALGSHQRLAGMGPRASCAITQALAEGHLQPIGDHEDGSVGVEEGRDAVEEANLEDEEGEEAKVRRAPKGPTHREREEHEATHIPYRSWCKHCVRGRAPNRPHRASIEEADDEKKQFRVPRISMDYFFMGQEGEKATECPMLVMVDESTDNRYMRAVGRKGLGEGHEMEWLIKDMSEELKSWGYPGGEHGELVLRSDGEHSIKAVRDALGKYHGGKITPEQPPPGESQSNGRVEEAGKTLRSFVRVFKDVIEEGIGQKIPTDAVILQWLVRWVAMMYSRFRRGADGKTAYERQRGRKCRQEVVPFGERIHYRRLEGENKNKLESKWETGIWLGHARGSSESLIGTSQGVVRAWAIKRMPAGERWIAEEVFGLQGIPARPNPQAPGCDIPIAIHLPDLDEGERTEEVRAPRVEAMPRRTYLKDRDFKTHGYTENCEGCRRLRTGGMGARPHTDECRTRIEAKLREAEDPRWARAKARMDEALWEEIQRQEAQAKAGSAEAAPGSGKGEEAASSSGSPGVKRGGEEEERENGAKKQKEGEEDTAMGSSEPMEEATHGSIAGDPAQGEVRPSGVVPPSPDAVRSSETTLDQRGTKREADETLDEHQAVRVKLQEEDPMDTQLVHSLKAIAIGEERRYRMSAGEVMDIASGWDFRLQKHRIAALELLERKKPLLVIGSSRCTLAPRGGVVRRGKSATEHVEREAHTAFVTKLYAAQIEAGRLFLHEHPPPASMRSLREVLRLEKGDGVYTVLADQCMFGLNTWRRSGRPEAVARARTRFTTNSYHVAVELDRKCGGAHRHQEGHMEQFRACTGGVRRAIHRGLVKEHRARVGGVAAVAEVMPSQAGRSSRLRPPSGVPGAPPDPEDFHETGLTGMWKLEEREGGAAWDDITGMPLDSKKVQDARREEIEYVRQKNVWTKMTRAEALRHGYQVIKTRWIDINKGDDKNPVYRSRFVAKDFNTGDMPGLFAGTPPLEAVRYLVHQAATWDGEEKVIMVNDIARAFFEAAATRKVCIEIPEEDRLPEDRGKDLVGLLNMSLYGTRDAAKNWQEEVARSMKQWGFIQGVYNPCLYYHPAWDILTLVHGDDFVSVGHRENMRKFKKQLEGRFKTKSQVIGTKADEESSEARVLNRVIRVTPNGWEYEPDQRHVDMLVDGLGLRDAKPVMSPGEEEKKHEIEENAEELPAPKHTIFRGHAARLNYLATDRPDIAYSVKEVCRSMAKPTVGAWKQLKRIARYLIRSGRTVLRYPWQGEEIGPETYSDSDWAGCKRTGRSTSGGAVTVGDHYIKGWSSTQASVTLSSAEAELVAMTKAVAETIGIVSMAQDLGRELRGVVYADSSAALAIAGRKGSGKLRHINVRMLWIQEKEKRGEVELRKIHGLVNPADLMTKYVDAARMKDLMSRLGQEVRGGRAQAGLETQGNGN